MVFGSLVFSMTSQLVLACSCEYLPLQERFEKADYVFTAKVIGVRLEGESRTVAGHPDDTVYPGSQILEFDFDPLVDHKGESSEIDFLQTLRGSCEPNLNLGQVYTFLVEKDKQIGICGSILSRKEEQEFLKLISPKAEHIGRGWSVNLNNELFKADVINSADLASFLWAHSA